MGRRFCLYCCSDLIWICDLLIDAVDILVKKMRSLFNFVLQWILFAQNGKSD